MVAFVTKLKPTKWLAFLFNGLAGIALIALMLITCIDVFGRYLLNQPLTGSTELIEIGLGIVIFAAFPAITWRSENIVVDILDKYFSAKTHMIRNHIINIIYAISLYFIGDRLLILGNRSIEYGEETEFLHIPLGWSINFMGAVCWFTAVALLTFGVMHIHNKYKSK